MREILELINSMSPYLLLGFTLAGLMHAFVPRAMYSRYLSGRNFRSVLNAAILGIPLPLCSCGVIPTAMSLRKDGASKGATVSFLIATPQTGVDSIFATYSLMGFPFALLRPLAALATALFGGMLANFTDKDDSIVAGQNCSCANEEKATFAQKMRTAARYAYVDMCQRYCEPLTRQQIVYAQTKKYGATDYRKQICQKALAPHHLANDQQRCHIDGRARHEQYKCRTR